MPKGFIRRTGGGLRVGKTLGEPAYEPPAVSLRQGTPEMFFRHAYRRLYDQVFYWA
jgi:hypothetical protein